MTIKHLGIIEAGSELRPPAGTFAGLTLAALTGPAFEITEDGTPVAPGHTFGAGPVVIRRADDGNSDDSGFVLTEPGGDSGSGGADGRGIASMTISGGRLTGTYTDGTTWDAGAVPVGPAGASATIQIGTVTTLAPGAQATVTNRGTSAAAVLDFGIPRGADGAGGTLDVEAVQDIVGAMLGSTQGTYNDAAGTYTINLPAGSGMTDEQVQDIVGGMIRAGTGATVSYDDGAGTLTVSVSGGGGGQAVLSDQRGVTAPVTPPATRTSVNNGTYFRLRPTGDFALAGLVETGQVSGARARVWDVATATLLAEAPTTTPGTFSAAVQLLAGRDYLIGWYSAGPAISVAQNNTGGYSDFTLVDAGKAYHGGAGYPTYTASTYYPGFSLVRAASVLKNVLGPLDPVDMPRVTDAALLPNGAQALLTTSLPPRMVYRHTDGALYYGPVYSAQP